MDDEKGLHAKIALCTEFNLAVLFIPLQSSPEEPHAQFSRNSQLRWIMKT